MYNQYVFDSSNAYDPSRPTFTLRSAPYIDRFKVLSVTLPLSFYSTGTHNNQIAFVEGDDTQPKFATVPPGFYNAATYPGKLQAAMNAVSSNAYVVTYNEDGRSLVITGTDPFCVEGGQAGTTAWQQIGVPRVGRSSKGNTVKLNIANFAGPSSVLLVSSQLQSRDLVFAGNEQIGLVASIDLTSPAASVIRHENLGSYLNFGANLSYVEFRLLDGGSLREIDLQNQPFSVVVASLSDPDDPVQ